MIQELEFLRQTARSQFPSMARPEAFLENAGGSQVPGVVIQEIARFLREDYVQTGAGYPPSDRATQVVEDARQFCLEFFGGEASGKVAFGPSSTNLVFLLSWALGQTLSSGDEIILSVANHESHLSPWERLQDQGVKIKWWRVDPISGQSSLDDLAALLTPRTKIVCFSETSNLVGDILDVRAITEMAHQVGAVSVVDCVASASHTPPAVDDWKVDAAFYSQYKVYGPHFAAMFLSTGLLERLSAPGLKFLPAGTKRFELGCLPYEMLAGMLALRNYFALLAGQDEYRGRSTIVESGRSMKILEDPLEDRLIQYVSNRQDLRLLGPNQSGKNRQPTFSLTHDRVPSQVLARELQARGLWVRHGNMYAWRLCEALGLDPEDGVLRISAVHTNTPEEIERVCEALDQILPNVS